MDNPQKMADLIMGFLPAQAVAVAAELGIADLLAREPMTVEQLAAATHSQTPMLFRLLRYLASIGIFQADQKHKFSLTPMASLLRSDAPDSMRSMARIMGRCGPRSTNHLIDAVRSARYPFQLAFGKGLFEYLGDHPEGSLVIDVDRITAVRQVSSEGDCNANGIPDACDIEDGTSMDTNTDGVPDECAPGGDLFRRGDSAFIVAAFDADDGSPATEPRQVGAFAAVVDRGGLLAPVGSAVEQAGSGVVSTLVAPWRPLVISLEMLNKPKGSAGRARFAPKLPAAGTRLSLSDLLLYTPRDSAPKSLSDAIPRVLHALRAPLNRQIGVFWETYGVRQSGERLEYALVVAPEDESFLHRALAKLRVVDADQSLSLQWQEVQSAANGIASRGLTVDLSRLRPGRYSVRLMLTSGKDVPIVAERSIDII